MKAALSELVDKLGRRLGRRVSGASLQLMWNCSDNPSELGVCYASHRRVWDVAAERWSDILDAMGNPMPEEDWEFEPCPKHRRLFEGNR